MIFTLVDMTGMLREETILAGDFVLSWLARPLPAPSRHLATQQDKDNRKYSGGVEFTFIYSNAFSPLEIFVPITAI